jgi:hypothetical protein
MKNVTISLDEETAAWARVEAAKAGKSLSRYVGDMLAEKRRKPAQHEDGVDIGRWIGSGSGLFDSPESVDAFVREERRQWD